MLVIAAPTGASFEDRAFASLYNNQAALGVEEVFRCRAARVDGFLRTKSGETILVEVKETLSWGGMGSATIQFLSGRKLLDLPARRGLIVFQRFNAQWAAAKPHGAWGQLALEASTIQEHIEIGALQILPDGQLRTYSES
jgi:hypothetical protein